MSNVALAKEHYLLSSIKANQLHSQYSDMANLDIVEKWLRGASDFWERANTGESAFLSTKTNHVNAWLSAFENYRRFHKV